MVPNITMDGTKKRKIAKRTVYQEVEEKKVVAKTIMKKTILDDDVSKEVVQSTAATNIIKKKNVREGGDVQQEVVVESIAVANKKKKITVHDGHDSDKISVQKSIPKDIKNATEEKNKSKPISKLGTKRLSKQDKVYDSNYKYMLLLYINYMS